MDLFAPRHLLIILVVVLLVFGTKKLKTLGSDLGGAVRGFKKAMSEGSEPQEAAATPPIPAVPPPKLTEPQAASEERAASPSDRPPSAGP